MNADTFNTADVVVVGAGPAGSAAAIYLARSGRSVVVIDKAEFPRDKCCGDGLTTSALRRLERLGFRPEMTPSWRVVTDTSWRSPSSHTIGLQVDPTDGVRIAVARRAELDAALLQLAARNGATVHTGHALESVDVDNDGVTVTAVGLDPVRAAYVIGADGMWSPLRRALRPELPAYLGDIHAFRQYFTGVTGIAREQLWVSFERDILPGYVWSFPVGNGGVNIGFGVARQPGKSVQWMKQVWPDILQRPHVRAALGAGAQPEGPHKSWPIPARINLDVLTAAGGRALFVGDAARVVDPLTGEGIGQALETAELAVDAIITAGVANPSLAARRYRRVIGRGLAIDNGFARTIARLVSHEPGARAVIRLAPAGPWKGQYALKWAFEDHPRAGLLTPWRWPERFATSGGAFR